jgi:acyl-CoA synthetase (AMP-forming)/AMP-acid ligase II
MEKIKRFYAHIEGMIWFLKLKKKQEISVGSIIENQSAKYKNKPLILFEDKVISYSEFNEAANRYSHLFQKRGFIKGDTVALLMDNRPEFLIIHAGLAKLVLFRHF